jgi:tetratricopeptide (TPR) repeat protein
MSGTWTDTLGMKELGRAYQLLLNGSQDEALNAFQLVAASYPDAFSGARAVAFVDHILDKSGRDAKQYLNTMVNQYPSSRAGVVAKSLLTGHLVKEGNYKDALDNAEALAKNKDKMIEKQALYDAGNIAWHYQDDKKSAEKSFRKLIKQYPDDPLSISAQSTLGEWSGNCPPRSLTSNGDPIGADSRMDNYPNPFNPSTHIRFRVPETGRAVLKIFNTLGQLVNTLFDRDVIAGKEYEVDFDASRLTSGVYISRLESNGGEMTRKLLLVK